MNYLNTVEEQSDHEATYTVSETSLEERVQQLENTVNKLIELLGEK